MPAGRRRRRHHGDTRYGRMAEAKVRVPYVADAHFVGFVDVVISHKAQMR